MNDADRSASPVECRETVGNSPESSKTRKRVQVLEKDDTFVLDAMWVAFQDTASPSVANPANPLTKPQISLYGFYYGTLIPLRENEEGTAASGGVAQVLDYYPYGAERINDNYDGSESQRTFIGQHFDDATDLSYLNARYYDGARGQFTSQDPVFWETPKDLLVNPQVLNSYSYGENNPIAKKDPDGREPIQSQLGTADGLSRLLGHVDKIYGDTTRADQLNAVQRYISHDSSRYIYTTDKGWIDGQHFFRAAGASQSIPGPLVRLGGVGLEIYQSRTEYNKSAFSYEDLPSNKVGTEFGAKLKASNAPLSDTYMSYMTSIGATTPAQAPNITTISKSTAVRVEGGNFSSNPAPVGIKANKSTIQKKK